MRLARDLGDEVNLELIDLCQLLRSRLPGLGALGHALLQLTVAVFEGGLELAHLLDAGLVELLAGNDPHGYQGMADGIVHAQGGRFALAGQAGPELG